MRIAILAGIIAFAAGCSKSEEPTATGKSDGAYAGAMRTAHDKGDAADQRAREDRAQTDFD